MMSLDKIIEVLQEAKDRGFDGRDEVLVRRESDAEKTTVVPTLVGKITDVYYTKDKVYIEYGSL